MLPEVPRVAEAGEGFEAENKVRDAFLATCEGTPMQVTRITKRRVWVDADRDGIVKVFARVKAVWPDMHLSTVTGLDDGEFIEVIYHVILDNVMVNLRVKVPRETPEMPTIAGLVPAADSYERELHDLLGVVFPGRDTTRRLVLPDEWEEGNYPLRKDAKGGGQSV